MEVIMYMTYKIRIYPTAEQKTLLINKFIMARKAYNQLVAWDHDQLIPARDLSEEKDKW